jgi:hypothetical protein
MRGFNMAKVVDFRLLGAKGSNVSPAVVIALQAWESECLMIESGIDKRIAALKADLDAVGRRAKAALTAAK